MYNAAGFYLEIFSGGDFFFGGGGTAQRGQTLVPVGDGVQWGGLTPNFFNPPNSLKMPPQGKILMVFGVSTIKTSYQRSILAYFLTKSVQKEYLFSKFFGDDLRMEGDRP